MIAFGHLLAAAQSENFTYFADSHLHDESEVEAS